MAYKQISPQPVVEGGTGSTSYTAGSVVFSNGTILTQDNSNLFWDDATNSLGLGTSTPIHTLEVQGHVGVIQTATAMDQHAFEITADAANFADFKALDITYDTGSIAAGDFQAVILINVDETASTGGQNIAFNVDATTVGSATIIGLKTGIGINAIHQETGTFGNIDNILNIAVDVTAALASGGAGNISAFLLDTETMTFGDAAQWDELEVILTTGASGGGIAPTFEFSTGGSGFSSFGPIDGTNGFRNTGIIDWEASDLSGWATNASGRFEIRITRTRNTLSVTPILDECQLTSETEHIWDSSGDVNINSLTLTTDLTVANGGTGASTLTGVLTGNGTSAFTVSAVTDNTVIMGSTSNLVQDTTITVTDAGEMVNPSQPAFLAIVGTTIVNVTGDGTVYTVIFGTEIFDQNSDFSTVTGALTAPVTGRYSLSTTLYLEEIGAGHTGAICSIVTSNRTVQGSVWDAGALRSSSNAESMLTTVLTDMDAADTATATIAIFSSTKTVDVAGGATNPLTYFSGALTC